MQLKNLIAYIIGQAKLGYTKGPAIAYHGASYREKIVLFNLRDLRGRYLVFANHWWSD